MYLFKHLFSLIDSPSFLVCAELIAIVINCISIIKLVHQKMQDSIYLSGTRPSLIVILVAIITEDLAWLVSSIVQIIDRSLIILLIRASWAMLMWRYLCFNLFIENLVPNQSKLLFILNRFFLMIVLLYNGVFGWLALNMKRYSLEFMLIASISQIYIPFLVVVTLVNILNILTDFKLPFLVRKLIYVFTSGILGPIILVDLIHIYQPSQLAGWFGKGYFGIGLSAILAASSAYFSIKQILTLDHNHKPEELDYF